MYSGTTFTPMKRFDAWFGAHQKIDRVARNHLARLLADQQYFFPKSKDILKFEGLNGPDGIKRKSPAQDEPWHFYDPADPNDTKLIKTIEYHYDLLVLALDNQNETRAAFEAAWLAHAIVDGLTPAHHYPYEKELIKLRGGQGIETRNSPKEKMVMHGNTVSEKVSNNWKMWGDKGLLATHIAFEMGVAVMIAPLRLGSSKPSATDMAALRSNGIAEIFKLRATEIAALGMYDSFYKSSWTPKLAKQVRKQLIPLTVNTVALAWYGAIMDSQEGLARTGRGQTKSKSKAHAR